MDWLKNKINHPGILLFIIILFASIFIDSGLINGTLILVDILVAVNLYKFISHYF